MPAGAEMMMPAGAEMMHAISKIKGTCGQKQPGKQQRRLPSGPPSRRSGHGLRPRQAADVTSSSICFSGALPRLAPAEVQQKVKRAVMMEGCLRG